MSAGYILILKRGVMFAIDEKPSGEMERLTRMDMCDKSMIAAVKVKDTNIAHNYLRRSFNMFDKTKGVMSEVFYACAERIETALTSAAEL